jgi:hypothetical protein
MDTFKGDTGKLHEALTANGIKNQFVIYSATNTTHVAVRFQEYVMPFFNKTLSFETAGR